MKRIVSILTVICVLCLALSSCDFLGGSSSCDRLNDLMDGGVYSSMTLKTSITSSDGTKLNGEYVFVETDEGTNVRYSVEQLSSFDLDGEISAPDSYKTVLCGSVTLSGGAVVKQEGDSLSIDYKEIKYPHFTFDSDNMTDIVDNPGSFSASVKSFSKFFGATIAGSDLRVSVFYTDISITDITVTYTSNFGSAVVLKYEYR